MSDQTIGVYKDLCSSVGKSFEVVPARQRTPCDLGTLDGVRLPIVSERDISFSARIDQLQEENSRLSYAVKAMGSRLSAELETRQHSETKLESLKDINRKLEKESRENSLVAGHLKGVVDLHFQGLKAAVQELQALQEGLSVGAFDQTLY
jgi:hypothetical protein